MNKAQTVPSPAAFAKAARLRHVAETVRDPRTAATLRQQALGAFNGR